jgi:hypothetical protein
VSATGSPPSPLLVLAVALAVAGAVGCGGGSDSSSSNATAAQEATATTKPSAKGSGASAQAKPAAKGQGSAAGGKGKPKPSIAQEEKAPGDHSIQEYGVEAAGSEKEDVLAAMHSFLVAMAAGQEVKVCAGLGASVRVQLGQLAKAQGKGGSCTVILARLLNPAVSAEASRAVNGTIGRVRVGGGNALVLFRPQGGKLSYFVMKEEGGAWKATSMGAGAQLSP